MADRVILPGKLSTREARSPQEVMGGWVLRVKKKKNLRYYEVYFKFYVVLNYCLLLL
jgi:hypothetical protein